MRMLKRLEEDFPQLQCHQPAQDEAPPPALPPDAASSSVRPHHACHKMQLPPSNRGAADCLHQTTLFSPRPNLSKHRLPQGRCPPCENPRCCWDRFPFSSPTVVSVLRVCGVGALLKRWQRSSEVAGRFTWSPAVCIALITPHVCVRWCCRRDCTN